MTWRGWLVVAVLAGLVAFGGWTVVSATDPCVSSGTRWDMVQPPGRVRHSRWVCE